LETLTVQIGKISNHILDKIVIGKLRPHDKRVLMSAGVGEDCGVLDFGDNHCIISCDPITGATKDIGKIAVHVACNDIATCGVKPIALVSTVLLPPDASEADLEKVIDDIAATADSMGISVIGGHTEVTDAVSRIVVSLTSIGIAKPGGYITSKGAKAGDTIVMTKYAGLEGTAILAADGQGELAAKFGQDFVDGAVNLENDLSVIKEGALAGELSAHAMHDVTEGGVYGAVWELAEAARKGVRVHRDRIPVLDATRLICAHYGLDPYKLVSSGSMLIATDAPGRLIAELEAAGVPAAAIAEILDDPAERRVVSGGAGGENPVSAALDPPGTDELYKARKAAHIGQGSGRMCGAPPA
jgi:hydrogenase maturation factor